ncbi:putative membrane protein [Chitinivorax tropicus]|uniref:Putative membrane protein n=1 Tax=Chitinivorax tropicus TaxID=714531 RepID=A0A840MLM2_9PROT|nr:DUF2339 domain-containing protein [Chitinivorax tropicus]MBB5020054.1 putative membrane protein [Chitinivorax tropicus]
MLSVVLLIIGALVAGALLESFQAGLLGAIIGWLTGMLLTMQSRLADSNTDNARLNEQLDQLRAHFNQVTLDIHERISRLEHAQPATTAPPAVMAEPLTAAPPPADAAPAEDDQPIRALAFDEAAILQAMPEPTHEEDKPAEPPFIEFSPPPASNETIEQPAETTPPPVSPVPAPPASVHQRQPQPTPAEPDWLSRRLAALQAWLLGGNTVLRIGILLLFLGLAFLLRYASERVVVPVELRYASVALAAVSLLVIGWRVRTKQATYGLAMQGTGIAVLYLTVFAAMRLHPLIPPQVGFALLVLITLCAAALAILQDALALALAGTLGGFAAPILASTGGGNHVALFSYFALLNAGIFCIAWFKAWRMLNLVGFIGTFGIGTAWGLRSYHPTLFASTEPFLVLFFLMYLAIGLLFARRTLRDAQAAPNPADRQALLAWSARQANYVDGTVLFGTPLIGFGLQYAVIRHLTFGPAFSALAIGGVYLILASWLHRHSQWRHMLLMEILLALGVVFGTLAIPLGLDAEWTSAAWAVEGAGIFWVGLRQRRPIARAFALCLQFIALLAYLNTLSTGTDTLLTGSALGAIMLGGALLFSYWQLRNAPVEPQHRWERPGLLSWAGLAMLDLIPALWLDAQGATMAWALMGLITLYLGLRLQDRNWLFAALAVQAMGGLVFLLHLQAGDQGAVLASGWRGLLAASMLGLAAIAGLAMAMRDPVAKTDPAVMRPLGLGMLSGLVFINLAVLFVAPWKTTSAVWAVSGLGIIWLSAWLKQRWALLFGLVLQIVGGAALIWSLSDHVFLDPTLTPLGHIDFWAPATLALAAYLGGWRLWRETQRQPGADQLMAGLGHISSVLLTWATAWWAYAWSTELWRLFDAQPTRHLLLVVLTLSVWAWQAVARRWQWQAMAVLSAMLMPAAGGLLLISVVDASPYHPLADWGWLGWTLVVAMHGLTLRKLDQHYPVPIARMAHVGGVWVMLLMLSCEMRALLLQLSDEHTAWRWLGGVVVPAAYLVAMTSQRIARWWPIQQYEARYRNTAAWPVAVVSLGWFWLSNVMSPGLAAPLPYLPLLNPLEIGQLLVLASIVLWLQARAETWPPTIARPHWQVAVGASLWLMLSCAVFRGAHQLADVPFQFEDLMRSMLVQASLSLVWSLAALGLMITAHRRGWRQVWMIGAALAGIVVTKLFLVELGNRGGLARIVSFIGVGVLLLIVGYFAPLPPKPASQAKEDNP